MSRWHTVQQFNLGVYNIIIASDDRIVDEAGPSSTAAAAASKEGEGHDEEDVKDKKPDKKDDKKKGDNKQKRRDKESGVSRGIDFQHLSNVINFDFPLDSTAYLHRVGRTARGNNQVRIGMLCDPWPYLFLLQVCIHISFIFIREQPCR